MLGKKGDTLERTLSSCPIFEAQGIWLPEVGKGLIVSRSSGEKKNVVTWGCLVQGHGRSPVICLGSFPWCVIFLSCPSSSSTSCTQALTVQVLWALPYTG